MRAVLASLAVVALTAATTGQSATETSDLDARVRGLARQLRCLVCQNETLADSGAPLANDLRRAIREQMAAGRSDEHIVAFLTARYGDFVLYRPPLKPTTYALWFGPFVLLAVAVAALYRSVRAAGAHRANDATARLLDN